MSSTRDTEQFAGFWRRFRVTPRPGSVLAEVEDDYHCMGVTINHDGVSARAVTADMRRVPWSTCPGAAQQLSATFDGHLLSAFAQRGDKTANCTHLHDLAVLAAAHAHDGESWVFDIFVTDPVDGVRHAEIWCNGERGLSWSESHMTLTSPPEIAGTNLFGLSQWIASLEAPKAELARLLRWANVIANGRQIPLAQQSDARVMPPNCFSFQPARAAIAERIGVIRDFSLGRAVPLEG